MKPLKYMFVFLFLALCCFLTTTEALASAAEQVYTLRAKFVEVDVDEDGLPGMKIELYQDGKMDNLDLWFELNCRFVAPPAKGLPPEQVPFDEFAERFVGNAINIDFVVRNGVYLIVECRSLS